jgi:hypothetical protein
VAVAGVTMCHLLKHPKPVLWLLKGSTDLEDLNSYASVSLTCVLGIPGWQEYVVEANSCHSSDSHILYGKISIESKQQGVKSFHRYIGKIKE